MGVCRRPWILLLGGLAVLGGSRGATLPGATIPVEHTQTLTGERVDLPDALRGKVGVLVVGFTEGSREEVAVWGRRLAGDYGDASGVTYFEMADLEPVPRLLRGWVLKKIRESVPAPAQGRVLALTEHEAEWKRATGFAQADDAYVLVVDADGTIRCKMNGHATVEAYAEVKRRVDAMRDVATSRGFRAHP